MHRPRAECTWLRYGISILHTSFIAIGTGMDKHKGHGVKDIASVVAHLLGLDFKAQDSRLIPGIIAK